MANKLTTEDYLFLKFRTLTPKLEDICEEYYPHLKKEKVLERARNKAFPFPCYRIDESQKAPYFINLNDFAIFLDRVYRDESGYLNTEVHHACSSSD